MSLKRKWRNIMLASIMTVASGAAVMLFGKNVKRPPAEYKSHNSIHGIQVTDVDGRSLKLEKYAGKKILIVNVASRCGYTGQYRDLQKLYDEYGDKVEILAVPCNDFGGQEPGSLSEISNFCKMNFGVTFPILKKVNIKSNPIDPLYSWLSDETKNGWNSSLPSWNFCKYLVDEKGTLIRFFRSGVNPMSSDILSIL